MQFNSNKQLSQQIKYRIQMQQYPYRSVYQRKFLGKVSNLNRMFEVKNIIMSKDTETKLKQLNQKSPSLTPKIKQLIKINKHSLKKAKTKSQKLSALQLYLNKKLLNKQKDAEMLKKNFPQNYIKDIDFNHDFQNFIAGKKQNKNNGESQQGIVFMFLDKEEQNDDLSKRRNQIQIIANHILQTRKFRDTENEEKNIETLLPKKQVLKKAKSTNNIQHKTINWVLTQCSKYKNRSVKNLQKFRSHIKKKRKTILN